MAECLARGWLAWGAALAGCSDSTYRCATRRGQGAHMTGDAAIFNIYPLIHLGALTDVMRVMSQPAGMAVFFTLQFLLALPGVAWLFNEFVRLTRLERSITASS